MAGQAWEPSTPLEVVRYLSELTGELRSLTRELQDRDARHSTAQRNFDLAEARAYLDATGTIPEKKAQVTLQCAMVAEELAAAGVLLRSVKARIDEVETRIEVGRTYGATLRAEFSTFGMSGGVGR